MCMLIRNKYGQIAETTARNSFPVPLKRRMQIAVLILACACPGSCPAATDTRLWTRKSDGTLRTPMHGRYGEAKAL